MMTEFTHRKLTNGLSQLAYIKSLLYVPLLPNERRTAFYLKKYWFGNRCLYYFDKAESVGRVIHKIKEDMKCLKK